MDYLELLVTNKEYQEWGRQYWKNVYLKDSSLHAVLGIGSEAGELQDLFKKNLSKGKEITADLVVDEIGDLLYYVARLLDDYDLSFEEAMEKNRVKLDYRMAFGKNKEEEAKLQKQVSIVINGGAKDPNKDMRYA